MSLGSFLRGAVPRSNPGARKPLVLDGPWTRLHAAQAAAFDRAVRGRDVVDLGAGSGLLSRRALTAGARSVLAIEPSEDTPPRGVPVAREAAATWAARGHAVDVLVLGWAPNYPTPGFVELVRRAARVIYVGKGVGYRATGTRALWRELVLRAPSAYLPGYRSTLIVYDGPGPAVRELYDEERGGVDPETVYPEREGDDAPLPPALGLSEEALRELFLHERERFAFRQPETPVGRATLRIVEAACGALGRCRARDVAWALQETAEVFLLARALRELTPIQLRAVVRHELGHLSDPTPDAPGAEQRADDLAAAATGDLIRYDAGDLQTLGVGRYPRPGHLHA